MKASFRNWEQLKEELRMVSLSYVHVDAIEGTIDGTRCPGEWNVGPEKSDLHPAVEWMVIQG